MQTTQDKLFIDRVIYRWMDHHYAIHEDPTPTFSKALDYLDIRKERIDVDVRYACICSDPMNGCPGDFAEDGQRKGAQLVLKQVRIAAELPKAIIGILDRLIQGYEEEAWEEYYNLPWNKD